MDYNVGKKIQEFIVMLRLEGKRNGLCLIIGECQLISVKGMSDIDKSLFLTPAMIIDLSRSSVVLKSVGGTGCSHSLKLSLLRFLVSTKRKDSYSGESCLAPHFESKGQA